MDQADAVYAVHLEVPSGDTFRVTGEGNVVGSCDRPCVLHLPRGVYVVTSKSATTELLLEGPVHIEQRGAVPGLHTTGLVLLVAGALVTVAAVAVPLAICQQGPTQVDSFGRAYRSENPCKNLSTPVVVGWVSTLTAGFGALTVGGILFLTSGARLTTTDAPSAGHVRVLPLVSPTTAGLGLSMTF